MARRGFDGKRSTRSTGKKKQEKKKVLIALEDTKSAKFYFEKLIRDKGLSGEVVFADHIGTDPNSVIQAIIEHKANKKHKHRTYEQSWAVFDKDDYSKQAINGAIKRAKDLTIDIAFSNESYELWILLHFESTSAPMSRNDLRKKLNTIFKEKFRQDYSKSSQDIYELIIGQQNNAIERAKHLIKLHKSAGEIDLYNNNPITTIFQLVEYLNDLN